MVQYIGGHFLLQRSHSIPIICNCIQENVCKKAVEPITRHYILRGTETQVYLIDDSSLLHMMLKWEK